MDEAGRHARGSSAHARVLALLGRPVRALEQDHAPMADLVRITAICFEDGIRFPVPAGNRLQTGADLAEIRALLAGWPRTAAKELRAGFTLATPEAAVDAIEAILEDWARAPELAEDAGMRGRIR